MNTIAAVTTAKAPGAIASIDIFGELAGSVVMQIFKADTKTPDFSPTKILTGHILDDENVIDHVVLACHKQNHFCINCHGNPLIVESILKSLAKKGAHLVTSEQFLQMQFAAENNLCTIESEAKIVQLKSLTIEGVQLISNQATKGLAKHFKSWEKKAAALDIKDLQKRCEEILAQSDIANLIINGANLVLAGPPNSGKSTLINSLAGKQKAIVTDIAGTTRDWVSATCKTKSLVMKVIDTAGLDQNLTINRNIDKQSQQKTADHLAAADLVLFVLDSTKAFEITEALKKSIANRKVLVVLNKIDLAGSVDKYDDLPYPSVKISAANDQGIDGLVKEIHEQLGIADYNLTTPACFTQRQRDIIEKLAKIQSPGEAQSLITALLGGIITDYE